MWTELVAIGDLHLDKSQLSQYFPNATALQIKAVDRVLGKAAADGIEHAVLLGDVCHNVTMSEASRVLLIRLLHFYAAKKGMKIWIILGNHDYSEKGSHSLQSFIELVKCGLLPNVRVFDKPEVVQIGKVPFHFLPYPSTLPLDKKAGVVFAHYEVKGAKRDNGSLVREGDDSLLKFRKHHYVQGHLHTHQRVGSHLYAGTLYQCSFGESLPKGYLRLRTRSVGGGVELQSRFVKTEPLFHLVNVVVNSKKDLAQIGDEGNYAYKLFVHSDVRIPDDFLMKHPNIVNRLSFKTEEELRALEEEEFVIENQSIELSHEKLLPKYLKKKHGMDEKQVTRALEILNGYRNSGGEH